MSEQPDTPSRAASLPLIGSALAFDFTNTASGRGAPARQEHLRAPEHAIAGSRHAKLLTPEDGDTARALIAARPELGRKLPARALEFGQPIYRIGSAVAHADPPRAAHPARA